MKRFCVTFLTLAALLAVSSSTYSDQRLRFEATLSGAQEVPTVTTETTGEIKDSLTTGDRYVKLSFHQKGADHTGELRVIEPRRPAQAIPGIYMLFVVDKAGVPSEGKQVRLEPET